MNKILAWFSDAWTSLSARERILCGIAGGCLVFAILVVGIVQPLVALSSSIENRVEAAEQQLLVMNRLRHQYDAVNASLAKVEERILANHEKRNLLTLLESLASSSSIRVDSMEERKAQNDAKFKETRVEVKLKRVSLRDTVKYLHAIESSDRLLTVKSLRIKNRTDKSDLLDVSFHVSTFDTL